MITDHPLGLPQGSVRAIIALMLSVAMVIGQYFGARPDRKE